MLRKAADFVLGSAAAAVDRAVTLAVEARARQPNPTRVAISHEARMAFLERIARDYPAQPSLAFFPPAPAISPVERAVRRREGRRVVDITWPSAYAPHLESYRDRYLAAEPNRLAVARLFLATEPRPVAVVVHGYMSGRFPVEERLWPLADLDRLGYDVALFVMPFHGLRAERGAGIPEFPASDPRKTIEGFRQTLHDLLALVTWLRRRGHPDIGLLGMSLGAYVAALAATLDPGFSFLVPLIPLVSLADFARERGSLSADPDHAAREHALLERLYRIVSPLGLPPRIASDRVLVVGARADRITPIVHARTLSTHFGAPLIAWPGGHLLQFGRSESFQRVFDHVAKTRRG